MRGHASMSSVSPFFEIAPGTLMGKWQLWGMSFFQKLVSYPDVFFPWSLDARHAF